MKLLKNNYFYLYLIIAVYAFITISSLDHCYFWDNIQQTSKEAHWFYKTDFSTVLLPSYTEYSFLPQEGKSDITGTGYHPPLAGIVTAALWKVFGVNLYVSHLFIFLCSILLLINTFKIFKKLFPNKLFGIFMLLPLLDSAFLTQLMCATPDIILITSFVVCLRAIIENKKTMLSISFVFLCLINGRGVFAGVLLFIFYWFHKIVILKEKVSANSILRDILPFLPALILLGSYFIYYFMNRGWFFSSGESSSPWSEHYKRPDSVGRIIKNIVVCIFMMTENGKIVIWLIVAVLFFKIRFSKNTAVKRFTEKEKTYIFLFSLFVLLYLSLAIFTQASMGARYNMPANFLLVILFYLFSEKLNIKRIYGYSFLLIVIVLSGNFFIYLYPEKTAKSWDTTLGHLPFYELRDECFDYLEVNNIAYEDVSSGFCIFGNQTYIDLKPEYRYIYDADDSERTYMLYSNISNWNDKSIDEIKDTRKWSLIKDFRRGAVFITLYKKTE